MEQISDAWLDNTYTMLLTESTRLLGEMKNAPDTFRDNEQLHSKITAIMKDILRFKAYRDKMRREI